MLYWLYMEGNNLPDEFNYPLDDQVLAALRDEQWAFRTVGGISGELCVEITEVQQSVERLGGQVRPPLTHEGKQQGLITAAERSPSWKERYLWIRELLATW